MQCSCEWFLDFVYGFLGYIIVLMLFVVYGLLTSCSCSWRIDVAFLFMVY